MIIRTDLALEAHELDGKIEDGVEFISENKNNIKISTLKIKTKPAEKRLDKPCGTYITLEFPSLTRNVNESDESINIISDIIRNLIPENGTVLIVGIGNIAITPDALGPKTANGILATRHIPKDLAEVLGLKKLRSTAVVAPGVLGQTGVETGEFINALVKKINPTVVIAIDALASRQLKRLGCTIQISDTGISPGAGVGNHRFKLNKETLGIPVISLGVPTVVDAGTLVADLLMPDDEEKASALRKEVSPKGQKMIVTPREIDMLIEHSSSLLSMSINSAIQPDIPLSDILQLI